MAPGVTSVWRQRETSRSSNNNRTSRPPAGFLSQLLWFSPLLHFSLANRLNQSGASVRNSLKHFKPLSVTSEPRHNAHRGHAPLSESLQNLATTPTEDTPPSQSHFRTTQRRPQRTRPPLSKQDGAEPCGTHLDRSLSSTHIWTGLCPQHTSGQVSVLNTHLDRSLSSKLIWTGLCLQHTSGQISVLNTHLDRSLSSTHIWTDLCPEHTSGQISVLNKHLDRSLS